MTPPRCAVCMDTGFRPVTSGVAVNVVCPDCTRHTQRTLSDIRERPTLRPDEAHYASWEELQPVFARLSDADRAFVARVARVLAEGGAG